MSSVNLPNVENIEVELESLTFVLQDQVYEINVDNGWFEKDRDIMADMMLIVTEVAEATEAYRDGQMKTVLRESDGKPEGFPSELADIFIRLLDTCKRYEVNLIEETITKLKFNATRGYRHGGKVE